MAGFKTHVTFSSVIGCGYALTGMTVGMPISTSLVAGGLCGVSGMLPDVDSDSGVPRRETMGFAAAIVPMLLIGRFHEMGFDHDQMVLSTACLYFGIRFGLSRLVGKFSVHRGMWHSIPALLIFAGLAFLITGSTDLNIKLFKAFAVFLGALSHLILDEIYSVDTSGVIPKFKKSIGTAVKFRGKKPLANIFAYTLLAAVAFTIHNDPNLAQEIKELEEQNPRLAGVPGSIANRLQGWRGNNNEPAQNPAQQQPAWGFGQPEQTFAPQPASPPFQGFRPNNNNNNSWNGGANAAPNPSPWPAWQQNPAPSPGGWQGQ